MTPYYERAGITLFHGDCREVLPLLGVKGIVLTDPPYTPDVIKLSRSANNRANGTDAKKRGSISKRTSFSYEGIRDEDIPTYASAIADAVSRWCGVFSTQESSHYWRIGLAAAGLKYVRTCAWVKVGAVPQFTGDRPAQGFEPITLCHTPKGKMRWAGGGQHGVWADNCVAPNREWPFTGQKPEALMCRLVRLFTEPSECVIEPFAGSGTTLVAAYQMGRPAIGVEVSEETCDLIVRRLEQKMQQGVLVFEAVGGT